MKTKLLKSTYALLLMLITISMGCTREDVIDNSPVDGLEEKPAGPLISLWLILKIPLPINLIINQVILRRSVGISLMIAHLPNYPLPIRF